MEKKLKFKYIGSILMILFVFLGFHSKAQRVVIRPKRTLVVTPTKRLVVRRTPIRAVPAAARIVRFRGVAYHVHAGVIYRPVTGGYAIVRPPVGFRLKVLPVGYRSFLIAGRMYYYYSGTYYVLINGQYQAVENPKNMEIKSLPDGYKTVCVNAKIYYLYNGNYYEKYTSENGVVSYYNIGKTL